MVQIPIPWTANIIDEVDLCGAVRYFVEVKQTPKKWVLRKRYSDFFDLHNSLLEQFGPNSALPKLPPKCYWPLGPDIPFLQDRRASLQLYLDNLSVRGDLCSLPIVLTFISEAHSSQTPFPIYFPEPPKNTTPSSTSLISRIMAEGSKSLRQIFIFQQSLEVDTDPTKLSIVYDTQRVVLLTSITILRSLLPEIEHTLNIISNEDEKSFFNQVLSTINSVCSWSLYTDSNEIEVIKKIMGDPSLNLNSLGYYERQVAGLLSEGSSNISGTTESELEQRKELILKQIQNELEVRSKVGQAGSVSRLRNLSLQIESPKGKGTASYVRNQLQTQTTPQSVIPLLQKRTRDLNSAVELLISGKSDDGLVVSEVLSRVEQFSNDVLSWKQEIVQKAGSSSSAMENAIEQMLVSIADMKLKLKSLSNGSIEEAGLISHQRQEKQQEKQDEVFKL